jgi:DNA-binding NarL/FixJ family response regulator
VIRVLLADDQALLRAGFRMLIESAPDMAVVGEAQNGGLAVALAREHRPDVVLMDLKMPEVDGVTATRRITADPRLASVRVVVLTTFDDDQNVFAALRAGAYGFLVKDTEPDELLQAIRVVARGDALLAPSVTRAVIGAFTAAPAPAVVPHATGHPAAAAAAYPATADPGLAGLGLVGPPLAPEIASLTEREREVVTLVAAGLSNDEIAARLAVSRLTAKTHVSRAMTKLAARDRAQLVVIAYSTGLATPPTPGTTQHSGTTPPPAPTPTPTPGTTRPPAGRAMPGVGSTRPCGPAGGAGRRVLHRVFLSFVAGADVSVKQVGLGLAAAVLIDATLVRLVLVPAVMELLGRANWWLPRPLAWILPAPRAIEARPEPGARSRPDGAEPATAD